MSAIEKPFTKTATWPLLHGDGGVAAGSPTSHPFADGGSEMKGISWGRAIGIFNLYVVWLILDVIGL